VLIVIGFVFFILFVDVGLLPDNCSPHDALLVARRPSYRGAWGLRACQGTTSIVAGVVIPLCLFVLAAFLMARSIKRGASL